MSKKDQSNLLEELTSNRIDRRQFLTQSLVLGVGVSSLGSLLGACRAKETPSAGTGAASGTAEAAKAGAMEKELVIYNWSDYIAEDTVANFEKEFGVKVTYGTYESNEELIAKLQTGASGYDLVCPSGYAVQALVAQGLLEKLNMSALPNLSNIASNFRNVSFDPQNEYTVPWQWGMTGIAYRKDKVKAAPDSWAVFLDAQYSGKMTQMDDMRDVIGAWLRFHGYSLNSVAAAELAKAKESALASKKLLQSYVSAPVKGQLAAGDVWISQLWNGDAFQAQVEQPEIAWVLPKEGGSLWVDSMVIPKGAPHPNAAHAFLNYVLRPEVAAAISNTTGYGSPNQAAKLKKEIPMPSAEQMKMLEVQKDLGKDSALWDQIWTEIKAG